MSMKEIMAQKEQEFLMGHISCENFVKLAIMYEKSTCKQYSCSENAAKKLIEEGYDDDSEKTVKTLDFTYGKGIVSEYIPRTKEEVEEVELFYVLSPIMEYKNYRNSIAIKEVQKNRDKYVGRKIYYTPAYRMEEKKVYEITGIGEKCISVINQAGEQHFYWFGKVPLRASNAYGWGADMAIQIVIKYGTEEMRKKVGGHFK